MTTAPGPAGASGATAGPSEPVPDQVAGARHRRGPLAWAGWALAGLLAGWLVLALAHQIATGSYWLWGVPDPLPSLLFFAGPLAVVAAITMLPLARSGLPRLDRVLISLGAAQLGLVLLHRLLSGRSWLWDIPDLMPPPLFLLIPSGLLAAVAVARARQPAKAVPARWHVAVIAVAALLLGLDQSGLNLAAVTGGAAGGSPSRGAVRIVAWDTVWWDSREGPARFYRYLTGLHADVYLLQSYSYGDTHLLQLTRDAQRLAQVFPGYHFAVAGNLLTISRFPVLRRVPLLTSPSPPPGTANIGFLKGWKYGALRTDLSVGGHTLSVYNVHFYDRFSLNVLPFTPTFFRNVSGLDTGRRAQFESLRASIENNPGPVVVAGNFNAPPGDGDFRWLSGLTDASRASTSLYPATFSFFGPALWRVDWAFTSAGLRVDSYALPSPGGMSSHSPQDVLISLPWTVRRP